MEFGFKFWFLVAGSLLLIGVLGHGLWLTFRGRSDANDNASPNVDSTAADDDDPLAVLSAELPGRGAKAVEGEQAQFTFDEPVPMLMETTGAPAQSGVSEPAESSDSPVTDELEAVPEMRAERRPSAARPAPHPDKAAAGAPSAPEDAEDEEIGSSAGRGRPVGQARATESQGGGRRGREPQAEIIVVYVVAREPGGFAGGEVVRVVSERGLSFGDMNIFHHYVGEQTQYSMASATEPGTFDLAVIDDATLSGVVFFLQLPGPADANAAFEHLIGVASALADQLNGDLRDEQHSALTRQGIEHARERVRNFERRAARG